MAFTSCASHDRILTQTLDEEKSADDNDAENSAREVFRHSRLEHQVEPEKLKTSEMPSWVRKACFFELRAPEEKLVELSTIRCDGSPSSGLRLGP